jgi:uncharacterized protein (TIGR02147 family)
MSDILRQFLKDDFHEIKSRRKSYSLRAYARDLGMNSTSLSLFLNQRRGLSPIVIKKLATSLGLELVVKEQSTGQTESSFSDIDLDKVRVVSDWYYFAILSLAETTTFQSDIQWIADRLNIRITVAKKATDRLVRLGMLHRDGQGVLAATGTQFRTPDRISSRYLRRSHLQCLDLARNSIEKDATHLRNASAMTMAIDPENLPKAYDEIAKFRRRLSKLAESGNKSEVYRLAIQLFPLSHEVSHD